MWRLSVMSPQGIDKAKNPLHFVSRLLDDEKYSNLHLGDVRFWKHIEYIDAAQVYRRKSIEYRNMKLMFCEAIFYAIFIFAATLYMATSRPSYVCELRRQQIDFWGGCTYGQNCSYQQVEDIPQMFDWIRSHLIPKAFGTEAIYPSIMDATSIFRLSSGVAEWKPRYVSDTETSVLVGNVRLRQLRVQYNKACVIKSEWQGIERDCFGPFSATVQSHLSWAPQWTPSYLKPHFEWSPSNETTMEEVRGQHGVYPGDGFTIDLPMNISGATTRFVELQQWNWLDKQTRAVVVEMTVLNPNVNALVHNRMLFEFLAAGGVVARHEVFSFGLFRLSISLMLSDEQTLLFASYVIIFALHILLLVYVLYLLKQNGMGFFRYFWSMLDLALLLIFFIDVVIQVSIYVKAQTLPALQPEVLADPQMFYSIGSVVPELQWDAFLLSIHGLLTWLKVLKYFTLSKTFVGLVRVIERCLYNLALFASLMAIILFGFAAAFHIGYGKQHDLFSTLFGAFLVCVIAPAGGVSLESIFENNDTIGPLLFLAYFVLVFLLLLNTFLAICVDTYTVCMYELSEVYRNVRDHASSAFLFTYFNALAGVRLVGKETEEDIGLPEEQAIALSSLPEAIAERYLACKRKMEAIKQEADDELALERQMKREAAGYIDDVVDEKSREKETTSGLRSKLSKSSSSALAIEDARREKDFDEDSEFRQETSDRGPNLVEDRSSIVVKRVQLQRMLEDDEVLRTICGTDRAVDLMRRFRVDSLEADPYEVVAKLQARVAKLLHDLETRGAALNFDEVEILRTLSQEMHSALTDSQKEWREELLSVLQMATLLSKALVSLTLKIEQIQLNHKELYAKAVVA